MKKQSRKLLERRMDVLLVSVTIAAEVSQAHVIARRHWWSRATTQVSTH